MFSTYILPLFTKIYNRKTNFFSSFPLFPCKVREKGTKSPRQDRKSVCRGWQSEQMFMGRVNIRKITVPKT